MAYIMIQSPGTQYGPCVSACNHTDCQQSRSMAGGTCELCKENLGYDTALTGLPDRPEVLAHFDCVCDEMDRQRKIA